MIWHHVRFTCATLQPVFDFLQLTPHLNPRHFLGSVFRYAEEVKRNAEAAEVEVEEEEEAASQAASKKEQEDGGASSAGAASASASSEDGGSARLADLSQCVALMMHAELIDESEGLMLQELVEEEHFILKAAWEYYQVLVDVDHNQCLNLNTHRSNTTSSFPIHG